MWDVRSGKSVLDMKGAHTRRCYKAMLNDKDTMVATCGSDRMICIWDLRKAAKPMMINTESESCIMACDWTNDQTHVISSTIEGNINAVNLKTNKMVLKYDTLELNPDLPSNIIYHLRTVKNYPKPGNMFTLVAENKLCHVVEYEPTAKWESWLLEIQQKYEGHSMGLRDCQFNHNCSRMLTCCEDHSLRLWDAKT